MFAIRCILLALTIYGGWTAYAAVERLNEARATAYPQQQHMAR